MTPEKVAKELIKSFTNGLTLKDCALICVNEIIKTIPTQPSMEDSTTPRYEAMMFWQEVKKELNKL